MRGMKVQGHASMVRSSSCPGAIICTDNEAGMAALRFRQVTENREAVIDQQSLQIEQLQSTLKFMVETLGIELPDGGQDGGS